MTIQEQLDHEKTLGRKNPFIFKPDRCGYGTLYNAKFSCFKHEAYEDDCEACKFVVQRILKDNDVL